MRARYNGAMFLGFGIGPFIVGGSTRKRPDVEPEPFHEQSPMEAGGLVLALIVSAVVALGGFAFFIAAYVSANGVASTALTAFWFVIGIPLAVLALRALGEWGQRNF